MFDGPRQAAAALDVLNLLAAVQADAEPSSLPLRGPLESYHQLLEGLKSTDWETLCLWLSQRPRGSGAEEDEVEVVAATGADMVVGGPASAAHDAATQPQGLPVGEAPEDAACKQVQKDEWRPSAARKQQVAAQREPAQQRSAQQRQGRAGLGQGRDKKASRLGKAGLGTGQTSMYAYVQRLPAAGATVAETPAGYVTEQPPMSGQAQPLMRPAQSDQLAGPAVAAARGAAAPAHQAAVQAVQLAGVEQQAAQQREQLGHQGPMPHHTAIKISSGHGEPERKRQRRSEAERLQPFSWDSRQKYHPFNQDKIRPSSSRRPSKLKRGLFDSTGPPPSVSGGSNGMPAQRAEHAMADTACTPVNPPAAAVAEAVPAQPVASETEPAGFGPAGKGLEEAAAQGQRHSTMTDERPAGHDARRDTAVPSQDLPQAAGQPASSQQVDAEGQRSGDLQVEAEGQRCEEQDDEQSQGRQSRDQEDAVGQQSQEGEQSQGQQAEQAPVPPPALAGLAFGAAWLALQGDLQRRAAEARAAELAGLLAPVARAGAGAARAVQRFTACFCSVLAPHQQAQHLRQLRAELAAGGVAAVREWVDFTLRVLRLP